MQVVGVSVDSVDKHLDFSKKYGLDFPLLSDQGNRSTTLPVFIKSKYCVFPGGLVSSKYGSLLDLGFIGKFSNRQTFIIGPNGKVEYVFTDVDSHINQHSGEVLAKVSELSKSD